MFPDINAKIIGPRRIVNRLGVPLLALGALALGSPRSFAETEPAFDRSAFSHIQFSEGCTSKQWMLAPDNSIELLVAPPSRGMCEITLPFYFPQDATSAVAFEARSTGGKPFLRFGVQETPHSPTQWSVSFPEEGLDSDWAKDGVRLRHLKKNWEPRQVSALHFMILPNGRHSFRHTDVVTLRNIRFVGSPLASPAPVTREPEATAPADVAIPETKAVAAAPLSTPPAVQPPAAPSTRVPPSHPMSRWLWMLGAVCLALIAWAGRPRRRRILSPLYEINMRTWKTEKDPHDVVEFGGFSKISTADLKQIKQAGFNTVWLMGIWEIGPKVREISKNYASDFKGSPFAIYDYTVSSDLGSEDTFRELVQRAHANRLSVIVDFVPNHMGLDSAWLNDHPEHFIHKVLDASEAELSDDDLKQRYPGYFPYRSPSYPEGDHRVPKVLMIAYGKDPYFYPWIDTAQLDYAHPGLRERMIQVLCRMAKVVDGVRCDMAMLTLREQVKIHRHPDMSWETFNQLMPQEFWTEAIQAAKRVNPNFVFMAETYWSMEGFLQKLGFDYTYNKPLYEAICSAVHSGHAEGLMNFLRLLGTDFLKRSVHFLENHDEERAMNALGDDRQRAAAAILCTLPGIALLYQGQMEGKRERLPVQRVIPLHQEPEHRGLRQFYRGLLRATSLPVFQEGRLTPLYSNNAAFASYVRTDEQTKVLVVVNTSNRKQAGSIALMPGLRLQSGIQYRLEDLFYEFKTHAAGSVQPSYLYSGAKLMNHGLYVELEPFDAHIFVLNAKGAIPTAQKALRTTRQALEEWPLNRVARRFLGTAFARSSDTNLAANPTGRQS